MKAHHAECGDRRQAVSGAYGEGELKSQEHARTSQFLSVRMHGDSMEPTILPGSMVLVREHPQVEDGEIALVAVNSEEATIRRVYRAKGWLVLMADNPRYPPMVVEPGEARIIGRVAEVRYKPQ